MSWKKSKSQNERESRFSFSDPYGFLGKREKPVASAGLE